MKTITISDETFDALNKIGVEYEEGETIYEEKKWYYSQFANIALLLFGTFFISLGLFHYMSWRGWLNCTNNNEESITPTLTGEYGSPDGWETLTGPYVE